jgi:hypothetical protein
MSLRLMLQVPVIRDRCTLISILLTACWILACQPCCPAPW